MTLSKSIINAKSNNECECNFLGNVYVMVSGHQSIETMTLMRISEELFLHLKRKIQLVGNFRRKREDSEEIKIGINPGFPTYCSHK